MSNTNYSYSGSDLGSQFGLPNPALNDWLKLKEFKYSPSQNTLYPTTAEGQPVVPAGEPYSQAVKDQLAYAKNVFPVWQQMQQSAAKTSAELTRQQLSDLFPYYDAAASRSTERNLNASERFLEKKDQTATAQALRNQIASGQIASSQAGEAELYRATAAQALAAKEFARGYAGSTFRMT